MRGRGGKGRDENTVAAVAFHKVNYWKGKTEILAEMEEREYGTTWDGRQVWAGQNRMRLGGFVQKGTFCN